jgi:gas vesicle protein
MDTGKVILGALAGLATGAILGILFAPEKGTETRKKIANKGKDAADELKDNYNSIIDSLTSKLETAKNEGKNYYDEGKGLVQNAKNQLDGVVK